MQIKMEADGTPHPWSQKEVQPSVLSGNSNKCNREQEFFT